MEEGVPYESVMYLVYASEVNEILIFSDKLK
jgi:hypothetical protein